MIYLLGVSHEVQFLRSQPSTITFMQYLREKVKDLEIRFIAEEASKDSFSFWEENIGNKTTVQEIADDLEIPYFYCDPNIAERKVLGIRTGDEVKAVLDITDVTPENEYLYQKEKYNDDLIRENYWLEKLKKFKNIVILFVLGCKHLRAYNFSRPTGFDTLLKNEEIEFTVLPEIFDNIGIYGPKVLNK